MAKKAKKEVSEVALKDPDMVIDLPKVGLLINKDNLTIERYKQLVNLSDHYEQFFNVKLITPKKDEVETKG